MKEYANENWTPQPQPDSACVEIMGTVRRDRLVVARTYGYAPFRVGPQPSMRQHCKREEWKRQHKIARDYAATEARSRARVMAAGADLLDKLELMVEYTLETIGHEPRPLSIGADILKDVRATIAKARAKG